MKKKTPSLLFVTDPWNTLDHSRDTTLRLAEEAMILGARCFISENRSISLIDGTPHAEVEEFLRIESPRTPKNIRRGKIKTTKLENFDSIFYRTDPPVDLAYLLPLQILAATPHAKIHTAPAALFALNEKWAPAELGSLFPKSLVSASAARLSAFVTLTGKCVLKPLYLAQSKGVAVLDPSKLGRKALELRLKKATEGERLPVIVQKFLPGISKGETRLWFVDGKLLAAVKKIPRSGEVIIDMDQGGRLGRTKLSAKDRKSAKKIGAFLKKNRILFAAIDLIDGKVTDFNHTSPGLLVAMEELLGQNLARLALVPVFGG